MKKALAQRVQEKDFGRVYEVDLHNAHLTELTSELCAFTQLRSLDLSFNSLAALSPEVMRELTSLVELKAYANSIEQIGVALRDCTRLECVDLNHNQLSALDGFQTLKALRQLSLEGNRLTTVANLGCCRHLRFLDLSRNCLHRICGLEQLGQLVELRLSHNSIRAVENLQALTSLVELDLSYNEIGSSSDGGSSSQGSCWRGLSRLQVLRLGHNQVHSLALLYPLPQLQDLYLQGNPLADAEPTAPPSSGSTSSVLTRIAFLFPKLQVLDISDCGAGLLQSPERQLPAALSGLAELVEVTYHGSCVDTTAPGTYYHNTTTNTSGAPLMGSGDKNTSAVKTPATASGVRERKVFGVPLTASACTSTSTPSAAAGTPSAAALFAPVSTTTPSARPVMRPQTARTGGRDHVWSSEEAERQFAQFAAQLETFKANASARVQSMRRAFEDAFPVVAVTTTITTTTTTTSAQSDAGSSSVGSGHACRMAGNSEGSKRPAKPKALTPPGSSEMTLRHAATLPAGLMKRSQSLAVPSSGLPPDKIKAAFEVPGRLTLTRPPRNLTLVPRKNLPARLQPLTPPPTTSQQELPLLAKGDVQSQSSSRASSVTPPTTNDRTISSRATKVPKSAAADTATNTTASMQVLPLPECDVQSQSSSRASSVTPPLPNDRALSSKTTRKPKPVVAVAAATATATNSTSTECDVQSQSSSRASSATPPLPNDRALSSKTAKEPKPAAATTTTSASTASKQELPLTKGEDQRESSCRASSVAPSTKCEVAIMTDAVVGRIADPGGLAELARQQRRAVVRLSSVAEQLHASVDELYDYARGDEFVPLVEALVKELPKGTDTVDRLDLASGDTNPTTTARSLEEEGDGDSGGELPAEPSRCHSSAAVRGAITPHEKVGYHCFHTPSYKHPAAAAAPAGLNSASAAGSQFSAQLAGGVAISTPGSTASSSRGSSGRSISSSSGQGGSLKAPPPRRSLNLNQRLKT